MLSIEWDKKKQVVDIFGPWQPFAELTANEAAHFELPPVVLHSHAILARNVELEEHRIPFTVYDELRMSHGIDVTALSVSQTSTGNLYRNYVLVIIPFRG